jgi:hypothetical protein
MREPDEIDRTPAELSPKQYRAIEALLDQPTLNKAAAAAGVGRVTLWRWLQTPDFNKAFMHARWNAVQQCIARIQRLTSEAASTLEEIVKDKSVPASSRVTAANSILATAIKGVELEDHDERIAEIQRDLELFKTEGLL